MSLRMKARGGDSRALVAILAALAGLVLLLPNGAKAATVVNGDFETGNLTGWTNSSTIESSWFAYSGTNAPISFTGPPEEEAPRQVIAPPQGNFAATSDENGPSTHILYQDVALDPGMTHSLSMLVYYKSEAPIAVPSPDTLTVTPGLMLPEEEEPANQQYRVDVMSPGAPVDSVNPSDILANVFRTNVGDPQTLQPKQVSVDLSAFAGQTVRLRLADADNENFFNAGADAVSITSVPISDFQLGKLKLNKKKGTAKLTVTVPGPGVVKSVDVRSLGAKAAVASKKKAPSRVKKAKVKAAAAGKVSLTLRPTAAGKKTLESKHKLSFKVRVTFTPTGGTAASQKFKGKLKLTP